MKKQILAAIICAAMLAGCGAEKVKPEPTTQPVASPSAEPGKDRGMITPVSDYKDVAKTVLGESEVTIDGETAQIILSTSAVRDSDGYVMWDDSQQWTLRVEYKGETYILFDSHIHGKLYFDVTERGGKPEITLMQSSTVGLGITRFVYADGAFYAEKIVEPEGSGNNIYSSIPDYM